MIQTILFSLWFFLPAGFANMAPIFISKAPIIKHFSYPIDFYQKFSGKRIFGDHKTIRGLITGVLIGMLTAITQQWILHLLHNHIFFVPLFYRELNPFLLGGLLGFGALCGDMVKSFFKRQITIAEGKSWLFFDQLDYIIGALVFSFLYIRLSIPVYIAIFVIWFFLHIIASFIGFLLHLKKTPI